MMTPMRLILDYEDESGREGTKPDIVDFLLYAEVVTGGLQTQAWKRVFAAALA